MQGQHHIDHGLKVAKAFGITARSPEWGKVRAAHLAQHPKCEACDISGEGKVEVHHIMPFHLNPSLELDPTNLITLCESVRVEEVTNDHHHLIGHLGDWKAYNPDVTTDVIALFGILVNDPRWPALEKKRKYNGG